jgi:hypothetical protein
MFWKQSLMDWIWWRNHVVAPFREDIMTFSNGAQGLRSPSNAGIIANKPT